VVFASGDVLEKALVYLGMTTEQLEHHRSDMRRCGQGTSKLTIQPHRKNLLRIDYRIL
jgi:isocitrate lyase